ncbi:MAG: hypothetical protein JXQ73_26485 [Phycisphaerae bacterium]|nr:hypothetical protein [Phycisphaerae bacterium]
MEFPQTSIGGVRVSRLLCGSNPFFGFSHFSAARDKWLREYFTVERIADVLACCLDQGVNGIVSGPQSKLHDAIKIAEQRTGKEMVWIVTPGAGGDAVTDRIEDDIAWCARHDVKICMPHPVWTDARLSIKDNCIAEAEETLACIRKHGMVTGFSTHRVETVTISDSRGYDAEVYIQPYNAQGFLCSVETDWLARIIGGTEKVIIAIKPLAAGRILPPTGLTFSFSTIKPIDTVCIGFMSTHEAQESIAIARSILTGSSEQVDLAVTRSKAHLVKK